MAQSVRIWFRKQLRLEPLNTQQREMVEIGSTGLLDVFRRVRSAQGPNDGPAKPLKLTRAKRWSKKQNRWVEYGVPGSGWARDKKKAGRNPVRDLFYTGQMLGSLKLRTVTENRAYASVGANIRTEAKTTKTSDKQYGNKTIRRLTNKDVAWANQKREPWLTFSPANIRAIYAKANAILAARVKRMVTSKNSGIELG